MSYLVSRIIRHLLITTVTLMMLICSLTQSPVMAGTIRLDNNLNFVNGTRENVVLGPEGLFMATWNGSMPNIWTNMTSSFSETPEGISYMVYDSVNGEIVLFDGYDTLNGGYKNETWTYNVTLNKWTKRTPSISPTPRSSIEMVYASSHGVIFLFGGDAQGVLMNDTWTYNLSTNTWTNMSPSFSPPARCMHSMAYDVAHDEIILFGGNTLLWPRDGILYNDTWTYNFTMNKWTKKYPMYAPSPRWSFKMVYDSMRDETVLYGGVNPNSSMGYNDTWSYDLKSNEWINRTPSIAPPMSSNYAMTFDIKNCAIIIFGGRDTVDQYTRYSNWTWSYDLAKNTWTNITPLMSPKDNLWFTMAYDDAYDELILFGGKFTNETWIYDIRTIFTSGTYTSGIVNAGGVAYFGTLSWDASILMNTSLRFQFRSADTAQNIMVEDFVGPDGTINTYYESSGQWINSISNGSRWYQYKAYFNTKSTTASSVLHTITLNYNLLHYVKLSTPTDRMKLSGTMNITWNAGDPDNDGLRFTINLIDNKSIIMSHVANIAHHWWQWNTIEVENRPYILQIIAYDDNQSIPLIVKDTIDIKINNSSNLNRSRIDIMMIDQFACAAIVISAIVTGIIFGITSRSRKVHDK